MGGGNHSHHSGAGEIGEDTMNTEQLREFGKSAQDDAQRVGEALMNAADTIDRLRAALKPVACAARVEVFGESKRVYLSRMELREIRSVYNGLV